MMQNLSAGAIRKPIPPIILFILLTFAGLLGFSRLGINQYPDVDIPYVTVGVGQPGAAPAEMEAQVTRIVENAVATVGDVAHIISTVSSGHSSTAIEFQFGKDLDRAVNDVRDALTRARADLPGDIDEPVITRSTTSGGPIMTYTVKAAAGGGAGKTPAELSWFVDNQVAKTLLTVPGVGQVRRIGGVDREVRVVLKPERLNAWGLTAAEVSRQLREVNVNLPGGKADLAGRSQSIRTLGGAASVEELRAMQITLRDGRALKLADIADVVDGAEDPSQDAFVDGKQVVAFQILRAVGSSSVDVADRVKAAVERIATTHADVKLELFNSTVDFTEESYFASVEALVLGALLAVIVVWWFLRDWRATLISAVAMPLSVIPTFFFMHWLGYSLNLITLLGLSLVVGVLVDDAIVEIENIVRHMRMGKSAWQAAMDASDEIGLAVVATTLAIVAVFVPVSFMSGVPGQFFRQFGISVTIAVLISLLVARLLTPVMGAYLLKPHHQPETEGRLMRAYLSLVRWGLAHRKLALLSGAVLFACSVALAPLLPTTFIPASDRSMTTINFELPPGTRLAETAAAAERMRQVLAARPEVERVLATVGNGAQLDGMGTTGNAEERAGTMTVSLVPPAKRGVTQREFEKLVQEDLRRIPGLRIRFGGGEAGEVLETILVSDNPKSLEAAAERLEQEMRSVPGVGNPAAASSLRRPELIVKPDLARAADLGVTVSDIATTVRVATQGDASAQLPKLHLDERSLDIRTSLATDARADLDALRLLRVPTAAGGSVSLATVAGLEMGSGPATLTRFDRQRSVSIKADVGGAALGAVTAAIDQLPAMKQLPADVKKADFGDTERMAQLFADFGIAMIAGVLLVYCVLVLLFHDFAQPLTIMAALPLSVGGALGLLLVAGEAMSLPATIGILMLMGIVTKNSILLVEYAMVALEKGAERGISRREAMLDACAKRARPILMTTVAMGAGMLPIALKIGADADFRAPMAIAVIGGLVTSTVLSLFYVPVVFTWVDDARRWVGAGFGRRARTLARGAGHRPEAQRTT